MNTSGVPECVILIGLPGAGKTTFYRAHFAATHAHVSKDLWPHARHRDARQQRVLDELLARGRSVVIDNTNPAKMDREPLLAIAKTRGARAVAYYFDVSTRAAVARNSSRAGRARVPPVAIFTTAKRLEPPTLEEGFDEVHVVSIEDDRREG